MTQTLAAVFLGMLRDVGHGRRINLVDRSYDRPEGARVLDYPGSSANALLGVARLIPIEDDEAVTMNPDPDIDIDTPAYDAKRGFEEVASALRSEDKPVSLYPVFRKDEDEDGLDGKGFYSIA